METSDNLISVIVPTYNAERTLSRCVDSILAQTEVCFEIILVDDGSTDSSNIICASYARRFDAVKLISQENLGITAARNAGLDAARGNYIAFVDSDDYIERGFLKRLLSAAEQFDADVCCCGFKKILENNTVEYSIAGEAHEVHPFMYLQDTLFSSLAGYVWNRLYRRSTVGSLRFTDSSVGPLAEDLLFNCALWGSIRRVVYVDGCRYCYVYRKDSLSHDPAAGIKDGVWALEAITSDVRELLPNQEDINELMRAREAQNAFNELLAVSGLHEYDWIRPRLISLIKRNFTSYCRFERSILKRVAYRVLPLLPPAMLGYIARSAGIQR